MKHRLKRGAASVLATGLLLYAVACNSPLPEVAMPGEGFQRGALLYSNHCAACHGESGRGDGTMAAFLPVAPRDFRGEKFRFISASSGEMATKADVERFIAIGSRPSIMPGHPHLTAAEIDDLAAYVRELRKFGVMKEVEDSFVEEDEEYTLADLEAIAADRMVAASAIEVYPRSTGYVVDTIRAAELFAMNCASCHGPEGRGDGSEELFDESGQVIRARDLTRGEYRGGALDLDLFWRIRCGIPGTPMPALDSSIVPDADVWQLVDYLRFLAVSK